MKLGSSLRISKLASSLSNASQGHWIGTKDSDVVPLSAIDSLPCPHLWDLHHFRSFDNHLLRELKQLSDDFFEQGDLLSSDR